MSQITTDKEKKPNAFTSRSLAPDEHKDPSFDKEGISIILESESFPSLFGRKSPTQSDHRSLQHILVKLHHPALYMASEMGTYVRCLQLQYQLQTWKLLQQCRCVEQITLPRKSSRPSSAWGIKPSYY